MARGDIQFIPTRNPFAELGLGAQNLVGGLNQQFQRRSRAQELASLAQQVQGGGQIDFGAFKDPLVGQLAFQTMLQQRSAQRPIPLNLTQGLVNPQTGQPVGPQPTPPLVSPTQQIAQKRLNFINGLQEKEKAGTINKAESAILEKALTVGGQTFNLGVPQIATNSLALGRSFRTDERIKDMRTIEKFTQNMVTAFGRSLKQTKNFGPTDIALAKSFQKLTDLGSTVREGEFATTFEGQRLINKVRGKIDALLKGGLGFTPEDRKELVDLALALQEDSKRLFNQAIGEFTVTSEELGLNTRAVLGGIQAFDVTPTQPQQQGQVSARQPITATNPQTGQRIQSFDGGKTWQPIQ